MSDQNVSVLVAYTTFTMNLLIRRSVRDEYGDEAIGYVQVQSLPGKCVVKGRVTPEHRVNSDPYRVTVSVNVETGAIDEARCHSCQARNGGCKHVAAFLFLDPPAQLGEGCHR